jgi:hypothetical protein
MKYHIPQKKNPSSGNQAVPCGWTVVMYTMNLTGAFHGFVNTPKNGVLLPRICEYNITYLHCISEYTLEVFCR